MSRIRKAVVVAVALSTSFLGLTGCGTERSVEAFCTTMDEHKQVYLEQMSAAQGGGLDGLFTAIGSVGDLSLMWDELTEVAPDDIRADVEAVSEAWQKQQDRVASGDWLGSVVTGLLNSGSMSRVDSYVRENCDGDYTVNVASGSEQHSDPEPEPELEPETETELEPEPEPELEPEPEPELEPEPEPALLTDQWTDDIGYSYTFELQSAMGSATKDIANATPGNAKITWSYTFAGVVSNTTPERNAPAPTTLVVQPMWSADSVICSINHMGITTSSFSSNWCTLAAFPLNMYAAQPDIPMNSSIPVQAEGTNAMLVVPEDQADEVLAALSAPDIWASGRKGGDGLLDCLLRTGSYYLSQATGDTGCSSKD